MSILSASKNKNLKLISRSLEKDTIFSIYIAEVKNDFLYEINQLLEAELIKQANEDWLDLTSLTQRALIFTQGYIKGINPAVVDLIRPQLEFILESNFKKLITQQAYLLKKKARKISHASLQTDLKLLTDLYSVDEKKANSFSEVFKGSINLQLKAGILSEFEATTIVNRIQVIGASSIIYNKFNGISGLIKHKSWKSSLASLYHQIDKIGINEEQRNTLLADLTEQSMESYIKVRTKFLSICNKIDELSQDLIGEMSSFQHKIGLILDDLTEISQSDLISKQEIFAVEVKVKQVLTVKQIINEWNCLPHSIRQITLNSFNKQSDSFLISESECLSNSEKFLATNFIRWSKNFDFPWVAIALEIDPNIKKGQNESIKRQFFNFLVKISQQRKLLIAANPAEFYIPSVKNNFEKLNFTSKAKLIYEILKRRTIISEKLIFEGIDTKIFSVFSRSDRQQIIKIYNGKAIEPLINLNYALSQLSIESAQLYARDWLVDMPILSVALAFNMKRGVNYGESLIVSFFKLKNANLKIPESSILDHLNGQLPAEIIKNPAVVNAIQLGSMAHYASSIIQPEQSKLSTSRADQSLCEVIEAFRALKLT